MKPFLFVFIGSGIGGVFRYALGILFPNQHFPWSTLIVNVLASFLLGIFFTLSLRFVALEQTIKHLLMIGFCGGLSTFSTFSSESFVLFQKEPFMALLYIITSVTLSIFIFYFVTQSKILS